MQLFIEQVLNGIGNGVVYGSVALALVLIFRTTGVLNFAQGEMALFSTYISWKLTTWGLPVVGAIAISMAISFIAGAVIERTLIRPMEGRSALNVVIITLGLFLGLNSLVQLLFGTDPQMMPSPFPEGSISLGDTRVQKETIGLIVVLLAECLFLWYLLNRTKLGLKLRAVASNPDSARLHGIRAGSMLMLGWAHVGRHRRPRRVAGGVRAHRLRLQPDADHPRVRPGRRRPRRVRQHLGRGDLRRRSSASPTL